MPVETIFPTTTATGQDGSGTTQTAMTNPNSILTSNDSAASGFWTPPSFNPFAVRGQAFGFSSGLQSASTINDVIMGVRFKVGGGTTGGSGIQILGHLRLNGTQVVVSGQTYSFISPGAMGATGTPAYGTYANYTYDIYSLRSWTAADFASTTTYDLEVQFNGLSGSSGSPAFFIDSIWLTVDYTAGSTGAKKSWFFSHGI